MYKQIESNKRKTWLLMTVFLIVIVLLGWVFGEMYDFGYGGVIVAVFLGIALNLISYFNGDKVALSLSKAKQIQKNDNPYVYRLVENLCITTGLPTPKIHIINDPNINAFATGRNPQKASIAITTGAIEKLENEELEGVIAHELSHIKNYDIRLMTIVIICVGIITMLADFFLRAQFFMGGRRSNDRDNGNAGAILMIIGLVLAILSPIFATLIQLAVSRKREYLADSSAALITRYPDGLANALEKIKNFNQPNKKVNKSTAHLYIASPLKPRAKVANLFSTHPPIEDRIAKLKQMA